MKRTDKIIHGLIEFSQEKGMTDLFHLNESTFIISNRKTRHWELILFFSIILGFWIWFILSNEKSLFPFFALLGLTIFLTNFLYQVLKTENQIKIDLLKGKILIENQNTIGKIIFKPKELICSDENQVIKSRKKLLKHDKNYRLNLKINESLHPLIDIEGDYITDKIVFGLNYLVKKNII